MNIKAYNVASYSDSVWYQQMEIHLDDILQMR